MVILGSIIYQYNFDLTANKMTTSKTVFTVLIVAMMCACQSKETKFINAEFSRIQATWKIENFVVSAPDSLKDVLKTGEVVFYSSCKYDKKRFEKSESCGGEFQINSFVFGVNYKYLYDTKLYPISLSIFSGDPNVVNGRENPNQLKIIRLMDGQWDMNVSGNTLTAKQVKNDISPNIQVSFTATRK